MKSKTLLSFFLFALSMMTLNAAIICPPDVTVTCYDDITNLNTTGMPTVFGYPPFTARYVDQVQNQQCNSGDVTRIWYIDANYDNVYQPSEHSCVQNIFRDYVGGVTNVTFPPDRTYTCKEDIVRESADWQSGPCDMVGVSVVDQIYEVASDACYKILRKYTVINWCRYTDGGVNETWTHTQLIKVIDIGAAPSIANCTDKVISLEADCTAPFVISNSATDNSECGKQTLNWVVEIDLHSDGTLDYKYGYNEIGVLRLRPTKSGDSVSITLPGRFRAGHHTVTWFVRDQCGHINKCIQKIKIKDTKKPTPYLHDFLTASFDITQMPLMFPARLFDVGSFDNCTPSRKLIYSFSPNIKDSIKIFNCDNAGFQFLTIYITDLDGNQEFVEVFLIAFDNGSCTLPRPISGSLKQSNGAMIPQSSIFLHRTTTSDMITEATDVKGDFAFSNISIYKDQYIDVNLSEPNIKKWDILDLKKLQNHILGLQPLVNYQIVAGDVDGDNKIRSTDLLLLKDWILNDASSSVSDWRVLVNKDTIKSVTELLTLTDKLDIIKYRGHADFKAVLKGDISDANTNDDSSPRSILTLEKRVSGARVDFYLPQNINIKGTQLRFNLPTSLNTGFKVESQQIGVLNHKFNERNNILSIISLDEESIRADLPYLSLEWTNDITIAQLEQISISEDSQLLTANDVLTKLRLQEHNSDNNSSELTFYPNPSTGSFTLAVATEVVGVYDNSGQKISFTNHHNTLTIDVASGIYFVKTISGGQSKVSKLFVIK